MTTDPAAGFEMSGSTATTWRVISGGRLEGTRGTMEFNLADLFEHTVDTWGDRGVPGGRRERRTYAELDERANRLAHHLADQGIGPGDHVGIYGVNSVEWVETLWAVFKLRAVWININYRYVADELAYLFGNAGLKALVHDAAFSDRVEGVADHMPDLRHRLVIGGDYEQALAGGSPERDFAPAREPTATSSTRAAPPACPRASCGSTRTCSSRWAAASTCSPASGRGVPRTWSSGAGSWGSP